MPEAARIRWNSFYSFISISARLITNVLLFLILARYYGPESFGSFSAAHTFSMLFLLLADFGFDALIMTEIARNKNRTVDTFQKYIPPKILFSCIAIILLWITGAFIPGSDLTRLLIYILSGNMLFTTFSNMFFAVFKGIEQFQHEAKISSIINIILLAVVLILSAFHSDIYIIAIAMVLSRLLSLVMSIFIFRKIFSYAKIKLNFREWNKDLKLVFTFGIHLLFGTLYFQIDTILLMSIKGDYEVGLYQSVFKLTVLILIIPEIFVSVILPTLTRFYSENDFKWKKLGNIFFKVLFLSSLPISLILYEYAEQILTIVYGSTEFLSAASVLRLASFIIFIRFSVEPFAMLLTATGRQSIRTFIVIAATIINLILNLIFIPTYGILGAIQVSIVTNLFAGILYVTFNFRIFLGWMSNINFLISLLIIFMLGYLIQILSNVSLWLLIPLTLLIYFTLIYFINFNKEEKSLLFPFKIGVL